MSSSTPPVPPDQQSDKIRGEHSPPDTKDEVKNDPGGGNIGVNVAQQGQTGNTIINTTNQGKQQDR